MERSLLLLSFALGGVAWLCGFLSSGFRGRGRSLLGVLPPFWIAAGIATPLLVFLATLPSKPPLFAAGHGLGAGFLVGGLLGLLAVWTTLRALDASAAGNPVSPAGAVAAPIGLALTAACVPSLWMRDSLVDALSGVAIGWLCSALLVLCAAWPQWRDRAQTTLATTVSLVAGSGVLFCALAGLGELRGVIDIVGKPSTVVHWAAPGLAFTACVLVLLLLVLLPASIALRIPLLPLIVGFIERGRDSDEARASARRGWRLGLCMIVTLALGRLVASRFPEEGDALWDTKSKLLKPLFGALGPNPMFHVVALGIVAALIICWLVRDSSRRPAEQTVLPPPLLLAVLTLVAASMIAFQFMGGFGVCLITSVLLLAAALAAASSIADAHEPAAAAETAAADESDPALSAASLLTRLVLLGTVLALYRIFAVRFESEVRGVGLTDHYALFGLLLGAALPPLLAGYFARTPPGSRDGDASRLFRLAVTGLLVLVVPTLVIALWGAKCALALLIGLALSTVFERSLFSALIALAGALALAQWTHHVLPLAEFTRDQKVSLLGWTTVICIVALLVADFSGRRRTPTRAAAAPSVSNGGAQ
jgi:hypothetical protein